MKEHIKKIADVLSSIGGVSNAIIFIVRIINKFINQYTALKDIKSILNSSNLSNNEIAKANKNFQIKNNSSINLRNIGFTSIKKTFEKVDISSRTNMEINEKNIVQDNEENKEKQINNILRKNKDVNYRKAFNIKCENNNQKVKIIFWNFLIYKCSCGKKNNYFKFYDNFRKKLISVENLIENNIKINGLLKLNDKIYET